MRATTILVAGLVALAPVAAQAGDGKSQVNIGYTHFDAADGELGLVTARYQYNFMPLLGVEAEIGTGVIDEDLVVGANTATISADLSYGLFSVAKLPLGDRGSNLFVRAGYQKVDFEVESQGASAGADVEGLGIGGGINVMFTAHHGLRLDYTRLEGSDDSNSDTYSAAYVLRF